MPTLPVRSCLACRRTADKPALVRLVAADGTVVVDPTARRPGRGAYLCERTECVEHALRRRGAAIARALRLRPGRGGIDERRLIDDWQAVHAARGVSGRSATANQPSGVVQ